jgi:hypothetical protein
LEGYDVGVQRSKILADFAPGFGCFDGARLGAGIQVIVQIVGRDPKSPGRRTGQKRAKKEERQGQQTSGGQVHKGGSVWVGGGRFTGENISKFLWHICFSLLHSRTLEWVEKRNCPVCLS